MSCLTGAAKSLVVGTAVKADTWILLIDVKPKLVSTISALQEVSENTFLHILILRLATFGILG